MIFSSTKGRALGWVRERLPGRGFLVPEFLLLSCDSWSVEPGQLLDTIQQRFGDRLISVRSSASDEDRESGAKAGEYDSILNVCASDRAAVQAAVSAVFASYVKRGRGCEGEEVLVQEMVRSVAMSGVVFTHELNSGAPYYVINYDDISGTTNTVTSGAGEYANRTLYIHRGTIAALRSERFERLIGAVVELEKIVGSEFLDIEFALDTQLTPFLLQVRAITTRPNWNRGLAKRIDAELNGIQSFVRGRMRPVCGVYGTTTVFGQMPDWNPAEMIGRAPRALSLSLYKRLITDDAWRVARDMMGYAVPVGHPLMVSLGGQPFIDTRLSFHSYLPASLSPDISKKLVDAWIARLREKPELHDKIEFEVAITVFSFDWDERAALLNGLEAEEMAQFRESLLQLTRPLLKGEGAGSIAAARDKIERLATMDLTATGQDITAVFGLVEACVRNGTIPFAILARHAFIARTLLLSLVKRGVLSEEDVARFQSGVRTVASEFLDQMHALQRGEVSRDEFMRRYGHLRPGTYDILSPRYDQMDFFAVPDVKPQALATHSDAFIPTSQQKRAINSLLHEATLDEIDCDRLLAYCSDAIAGREYGKFVFTRVVSTILEVIGSFGEAHGLSRDELSHIPIDRLLDGAVQSRPQSLEESFRDIATQNAERHALTSAIRLPQILADEAAVHIVPFQVSQPNFITVGKVEAEAVYLGGHKLAPDLGGRIVLIENADPGYDWIFAQSIVGLVTKFGGANSHMAIRCAEFAIPAAIGCGEQRFDALSKARRLILDCSVGLITPLH